MKDLGQIILSGFNYNRDKFLLFLVVLISTILMMKGLDLALDRDQVFCILGIFLIENFLTCGVYGSLKKILSGEKLTPQVFLKNCVNFFIRFLIIKIFFVISIVFISGIILILIEAAGKIPSVPAATGIVFLWLIWLSFPMYYLILSLFAPMVLFSENSGIWQSIKTSISFSRIFFSKIIIIAFLYFISVLVFVYFPEKSYNLSSGLWYFCKGVLVSIMEIGFISSFLLLYQKGWDNERNV
ncbi:MAG: hypothetical protein BWX89_01037 [candidate division TA06 bacterium ADurb.Bin131]|jgi:hypothetical protein|uniref:Uncharacterized protein n=1 Tax=candidate division TA06 bacterium ADurb.Bin131 TaxID=1852827 RepID=A0A1V6C8L8_UNCT6|nr:MAG: hypothetical protein BWX89_01037 [candidate division TA06 bacterium ADurb.Bin131]